MNNVNQEITENILASVDSMFSDDHYICCRVEEGFAGVTTAFCGIPVALDGTDIEWSDAVGCKACMNADTKIYCPLNKQCLNICTK